MHEQVKKRSFLAFFTTFYGLLPSSARIFRRPLHHRPFRVPPLARHLDNGVDKSAQKLTVSGGVWGARVWGRASFAPDALDCRVATHRWPEGRGSGPIVKEHAGLRDLSNPARTGRGVCPVD